MAIQPQAPLSQFAKNYHPYKANSFSTTAGTRSTAVMVLVFVFAVPYYIGVSKCMQADADPACSGSIYSTSALIVITIAVLAYLGVWIAILTKGSAKARSWNEEASRRMTLYNGQDFTTSQNIKAQITPPDVPPSVANPSAFSASLYEDISLGDVQPFFDQRLQASISGWLDHELSFHGWGAGISVGNVGLGLGQMGLSGQSQVNLNVSGRISADLLSDSLLVILEHTLPNGMVDTLRVIAPPEPAIREFLSQFVNGLAQQVTPGTHCQAALHPVFSSLASLQLSVSRVSDLLSAIKRQPTDKRPTVKVIGAMLSEGIMLGEAIQFAQDARWYNLFPISRCLEAKRLTGEAQEALASIPLPPLKKIAQP